MHISGPVTFETDGLPDTHCTLRYMTTAGTLVVRTFELDRPNRKAWEVAVQIGPDPSRKVRRPIYRCLDLRGDIVPVTDQHTIKGLLSLEVARNRSRHDAARQKYIDLLPEHMRKQVAP